MFLRESCTYAGARVWSVHICGVCFLDVTLPGLARLPLGGRTSPTCFMTASGQLDNGETSGPKSLWSCPCYGRHLALLSWTIELPLQEQLLPDLAGGFANWQRCPSIADCGSLEGGMHGQGSGRAWGFYTDTFPRRRPDSLHTLQPSKSHFIMKSLIGEGISATVAVTTRAFPSLAAVCAAGSCPVCMAPLCVSGL